MVGRPLTRAKRFAVWEEQLWSLLVDLAELAPRRSKGQQSSGEIDFWAETFQLLERAAIAASIVLYELQERAGMDADSLEREREMARGLWVEEAEDKGTENVDGAST